jgi:hypothetical protein
VAEELRMRRHWVNENDEGVGAMLLRHTAAASLRPARLGGGEKREAASTARLWPGKGRREKPGRGKGRGRAARVRGA